MNKVFLQDTHKAYASFRSLLAGDILRVPLTCADSISVPTKITISGLPTKAQEGKTSKVTFRVDKLGTIGEVEVVSTKGGVKIIDIAPSSLLTLGEAEFFLKKQKNGVVTVKQTEGIELCTRGTPYHDDVINALCGNITADIISAEALRKILVYMLDSTHCSPQLLYLLLFRLENGLNSEFGEPLGPVYEPIKTDKIVRAIRFGAGNVSTAEEQDLFSKLYDDHSTCLKDYLNENHKDCEASRKLITKSNAPKVNCRQTLLAGCVGVYQSAFNHPSYR